MSLEWEFAILAFSSTRHHDKPIRLTIDHVNSKSLYIICDNSEVQAKLLLRYKGEFGQGFFVCYLLLYPCTVS